MVNLRIDTIRNQLDTDILPKLSELQLKQGNMDIVMKTMRQGTNNNPGNDENLKALYDKLDERFLSSITDCIRSSVET